MTEIGFKIVATVCDQCSTNRKTYQCLEITMEQPYYFDLNGNKVLALFDMPHLIKLVRNSFLKSEFEDIDNGMISCDVVRMIVAEDEKFSTKISPKIGNVHIAPNTFQKMSVKLAFQLLSHSTYAAIKAVSTSNKSFFNSVAEKVQPTSDK